MTLAAVQTGSVVAADRGGAARIARRPSFVVAILGDGFAEALVEGLRIDADKQPDLTIVEVTHAPFGLADTQHLDWTKAVRTLLTGSHLDAAVIMLGANDMVPLPDDGGPAAPHADRWRRLYGDRVQAVADLFRAKGVPLTWVGLPIVEDEATSADFVEMNAITRDRATAAGATYLDAWNAFADEAGRYSPLGPDANGRVTRLRTADGIDLTRAGAAKLASFVEADLRTKRAADEPPQPANPDDLVMPSQPGFDAALDVDVNAQIRREAGLPAQPSTGLAKLRPGPVIAITAPVLAPDGQLAPAPGEPPPLTATGGTLAQRVLVEGQPVPPKAGRADDFSWPKP